MTLTISGMIFLNFTFLFVGEEFENCLSIFIVIARIFLLLYCEIEHGLIRSTLVLIDVVGSGTGSKVLVIVPSSKEIIFVSIHLSLGTCLL